MSAVGVLAEAMFKATDALMTNQPCICGGTHPPSTDCYMPGALPYGERPRESPANSHGVHIRPTGTMDTFCGQPGSTMSLEHYRKNPSDHVLTLQVCPACERLCQA